MHICTNRQIKWSNLLFGNIVRVIAPRPVCSGGSKMVTNKSLKNIYEQNKSLRELEYQQRLKPTHTEWKMPRLHIHTLKLETAIHFQILQQNQLLRSRMPCGLSICWSKMRVMLRIHSNNERDSYATWCSPLTFSFGIVANFHRKSAVLRVKMEELNFNFWFVMIDDTVLIRFMTSWIMTANCQI